MLSQIVCKQAARVPLELYTWHACISPSDVSDWHQLTRPLNSPNVDFITRLVLDQAWAHGAEDLLTLADMDNLGALYLRGEISDKTQREDGGSPSVSDRLVRGWSEKDKPFPSLRVLKITAPYDITADHVLQHASRFPCLTLCRLVASNHVIGPTTSELGWTKAKRRPYHTSYVVRGDKPMVLLSDAAILDKQPRVNGWLPSTKDDLRCRDGTLYRLYGWNDYLAQAAKEANSGFVTEEVHGSRKANIPVFYAPGVRDGQGEQRWTEFADLQENEDSQNDYDGLAFTRLGDSEVGSLLLPPRPMVCVRVSDVEDTNSLSRARHSVDLQGFWFERESTPAIPAPRTSTTAEKAGNDGSSKREGPKLKPRAKKRQDLGDLLSY